MNSNTTSVFDPSTAIFRYKLQLTHSKPAPEVIESHNSLVDKIAQFIERFVFIKEKAIYTLLALWVIGTYLHEEFEYLGYLFAHSPEPQTGKSRLLEVLDLVVFNSSGILVSPTESVLFRTAHKHTQLLDEIDSWTNRDSGRAVLNAGFQSRGIVSRMRETNSGYVVENFPVYAPRALAGIGQRVLDQTTRDRTFSIEMVRQKPEERRERFRLRQVKPEAEALRTEVEQWAQQHALEVREVYDQVDFPYLEHFRDRTIDVAQPLAAIAEVACPEAISELVEAVALTRNESEPFENGRVLLELARLARAENPLVGNASELAARSNGVVEGLDQYKMGRILHLYGFETKGIRRDGEVRWRYVLPSEKLEELVERLGIVL